MLADFMHSELANKDKQFYLHKTINNFSVQSPAEELPAFYHNLA